MISLRRKIDESEQFALSFQALAKAFGGLVNALPKAALPADPGLSEQCKATLGRTTQCLSQTPSCSDIAAAGEVTLEQLDQICRANQMALEERDTALKEVVTTVAGAISGFKDRGQKNESSLTRVADGFDSLSRIGDVNELRRQLHQNVAQLRESVEEMRRDSRQSVAHFESQIRGFEQRLEAARKGSGTDRLTGLPSRREAERYLQKVPKSGKPVCLMVFDIEGFGRINAQYGTNFGDKLLQALSHTLKQSFPDEGTLFRWGADEFLAIAAGSLAMRAAQARSLCDAFARSRYSTFEGASRTSVSALLACGAAQYIPGESEEDLYRRAREILEQNRQVF